ncbi:hypothetical protein ACFSYB_17175 [Litchfieldia salsa]
MSFIILFFNAIPTGFIIFYERLGLLFGSLLFTFTNLLGALIVTVIEPKDSETKFYIVLCFTSNLLIACSPLFIQLSAKYIFPTILNKLLFILN